MQQPEPRRPRLVDHNALSLWAGGQDPSDRAAVAHMTAWFVANGGAQPDGQFTTDQHQRLQELIDNDGLDVLAELWSSSPPDSLPGALWRLYALATWVERHSAAASREFAAGTAVADVSEAIAGVAEPPDPENVADMVRHAMTGVGGPDIGNTLDRVAAFARVVAAGRTELLDDDDPKAAHSAARMLDTASHLASAARRWRAGNLV